MKYLMLCSVILTMLLGCSAKGVKTEYQEKENLAGLQTYAWLQTDTPPGDNVRVNNPKVNDAVRQAVDKNLKKKGYQKVASGQPDFLVTWFGAIEKKVQVESINHFYSGYGYGPVLATVTAAEGGEGTTAREFEEGTILVDVLDPSSQKMQWRGSGSRKILKDQKEADAVLYIDRVVANILKNFPEASK
ncbi:MAG: DUF4136 domain-containing protein [Desulforhopalus sp.]